MDNGKKPDDKMHVQPAAARQKFLKGGKKVDKPEKPEKKDEKQSEKPNTALHEAFQVIDPIQTIAGPIGRFVPTIEGLPLHPSV